MLVEDGGDVQKEDRGALKRKPAGPPSLLLDRTRTRSTKENRSESKQEENPEETAAWCSAAGPERADELACRGRHRSNKRSRWWSWFSSTVLCIRKKKEVRNSLESPSEGELQKLETVPQNDGGDNKETKVKMRKVLRRFITSDVQQAQNQSPGDKSAKSFQEKLQKFFIRGGRRQSDSLGHLEDTRVEKNQSKPNKETDGSLEAIVVTAEVKVQLMATQVAEGPEPLTETPEEVLTRTEPDTVQTVHKNQTPVEVISEDNEVLSDSQVLVDLHELLQSVVHHEEKTTQTSRSDEPSMNGPSIRIEACPPEDFTQETEEEIWDNISPSENHLHLLFGLDLSERQLLQTARTLVQTALSAAMDQLSREQQNHDEGQRRTSELQIQRRGELPAPTSLNFTF